MATIKDVAALGYIVSVAREGVYTISGYGITSLYVAETDTETINSLADQTAYTARVEQFEAGPPPAPPFRESQLSEAIFALKTLDQSKPATIGDVVNALKAIIS